LTFTPKTWENPGTALTDLEARAKAEFDALATAIAAVPAGKQQRTARVPGPAMSANVAIDILVTWSTPFADANYTVSANVAESVSTIANGVIVRQIRSQDANGIVVRISNGTQAFTAGQVTLHAIAIHD